MSIDIKLYICNILNLKSLAYQNVKIPDNKEAGWGQFWECRKGPKYRNKRNSGDKEVKKKICNMGVVLANVWSKSSA